MQAPHAQPPADATAAPVAVLGEALVDVYPDGRAVAGGAPFNVARWLAAFGVPVRFISRIGHGDAAAAAVRGEMQRFGLDEQGLQLDPQQPTGIVRVQQQGHGGHRFEIASPSAWDFIDAAAALPLLAAAAPRAVYFGTLALRHPVSRAALLQLIEATPALRFADLNLRPVEGLRELTERALTLADWVKVNDEELQTLLGWFVTEGSAPPAIGSPGHGAALAALTQRFRVQRWIVTCAERGWFTADAQGRTDASGPAAPVPVLHDTVGAGDAFAATVLTGVALGWPLARSLPAASALGAAACGWRGALPATDAMLARCRASIGLPDVGLAPNPPTSQTDPR
jgi:fructokinase